jgi:iron complex outermembrane receptor protein/vitamin B12 transporter
VLRDVDRRESEERGLGAEFGQAVSDGTAFRLQAQYFQREEHGTSPGVAAGVRDPFGIPPNGGDTRLRRYQIVASGLFEMSESAHLTIGVATERESGAGEGFLDFGATPTPTSFALSRSTRAAFLEAQLAPRGGWTLHGGLRLDDPEGFASEISPQLGIRYPVGHSIAIKANWAQGFKLPSIFALTNPIVGNPALEPETSTSVDIGVSAEWWKRRAHAGATLFHNRFFNVIDLVEGPPPRLVNRSEVTAQGVEVEGGVRLPPHVDIRVHATYTQTNIEGTTEELRNRQKWRAGIDAQSRIKKSWTVSGALLYVGKVLDSSIPTGDVELTGYTRVDLAATWTPSSTWQVSVGLDNVLNARYEEAVGFPATGRTPRVLMRAHF